MFRRLTTLLAVAVLASACGGGSGTSAVDPGDGASQPSTTVATTDGSEATTTAAPDPDPDPGTTTASTSAGPVAEGPAAPDFTLTLSDGMDFVLSAEQKPVYMVFWAEW